MSEEKTFTFATAASDVRFPHTNQTKHCHQNFLDFQKCKAAKGEDYKPCKQFYRAFKSMCPTSWTDKWESEIEEGKYPFDISPDSD